MWSIKNDLVLYESPVCSFHKLSVQDPNGNLKERVLFKFGNDSVLIVPFDRAYYYMCEQYRIGFDKPILEFPNGGINSGELPIDSAKRELLEETGIKGDLLFKGTFFPLPGLVDLKVHVFFCTNLSFSFANLEDYERINLIKLSSEELDSKLLKGDLIDGYALSALSFIKK